MEDEFEEENENALDEWVNGSSPKCPLPAGMISTLRSMPTSEQREERKRRMIEHGDVDPDYFNR